MSLFKAPLTKFEIEKHPNADTLSIAKVGGWQCVVRTEDFQDETLAVYIPLDAQAAIDHPLLMFMKGERVKTCKLRGVVSQGVLLPYKHIVSYMQNSLGMSEESIQKVTVEGRDFTGILRVKRWEETRLNGSGEAISGNPEFQKYTDIENVKNFPRVLAIGEEVEITEKLHGTSARYFLDGKTGEIIIGSRGRQLSPDWKEGKKTPWHHAYETAKIEDALKYLQDLHKGLNVAIYGEIVGPKVQDLTYGQTEPTLFAYDILVDGQYYPPEVFRFTGNILGLRMVPLLKEGPLEEKDFELRTGKSTLDDTHLREGIVIKPATPRWNEEVGRVAMKVISEDYLMRKGAKDIRDE